MNTCLNFIEDFVSDMIAKISSFHEIENQVQSISVLEGEVHIDHKRTVELREKNPFVHYALHTLLSHHSKSLINYIDFSISFIAY